jgi:hypothetical protein
VTPAKQIFHKAAINCRVISLENFEMLLGNVNVIVLALVVKRPRDAAVTATH